MARPKGKKDSKPQKKRGPRLRKQFCPRRHDTLVTGRDLQGRCLACGIETGRLWKLAHPNAMKEWHDTHKEEEKETRRKWYLEHREEEIAQSVKWAKEHPKENVLHVVKWAKENPEKRKKIVNRWAKNNRQKCRDSGKRYRTNNPGKVRLRNLRSKTNRNLRIPNFGQETILEFYNNCPVGMVVDHILPLCGRKISGLHVIWNLQYLTSVENSIKNNKFDGTLENNSWRKGD
jgi:hypothetical protein